MENVRQEIAGPCVTNAGVENAFSSHYRGEKCGTRKCRTKTTGVENVGLENALQDQQSKLK